MRGRAYPSSDQMRNKSGCQQPDSQRSCVSHTGTLGGRWDLGVSRVKYRTLCHFGQWAVAITLQIGGPVRC